MLNLTSIILLFAFWVSVQAQQWELIDFGQGLNPNDEVVCTASGIKEPIPGELYALVYNSVGNSKAIAKSTDGGQTWTKTWLPTNLTYIIDFVINPLSPNEWYVVRNVYISLVDQNQVYKSIDFGQTWIPYGQNLISPATNIHVKIVEFDIDYSTGTLVGILEEEGWDWVYYYGIERSVNASGWTNSLYAYSIISIWGVSGYLRADREETPNVFTIGGDKKYQNFPSYYDYKIVTTNNDSLYVYQISAIDNSDLMYANSGNSIYKNEFGWSVNGNWELVNWSINGIPVTGFDFLWGNGNGFLLIFLNNVINVNGQDYFIFYSNDNGNTWQVFPFFNGLPNGVISTHTAKNISFSNKIYTWLYNSGELEFYQFDLNYLITDLQENKNKIETFNLSQNYPNPFNPTTSINYFFPAGQKGALTIFNTLGQRIKEFELKESKGNISWDGTNEMGNSVSSGVYFYQLKTDKLTQTKSMTLIK